MSFFSPLFAEWLLRGMALSALAAGTYLLLKPGGRARGTLLAVTTTGLLLLPLALWAGPRWSLGWIQLQGLAAIPSDTAIGAVSENGMGLNGWTLLLWFFGVVICLIRLGCGALKLAQFRIENKDSEEDKVSDRIRRSVSRAASEIGINCPDVTLSDLVSVPFVTGLFRPVIVLPADATSWTPAVFRAVLLHEMAHIRRGDLWMQAAGNVVCALYWFNPVVWFLHRRLAREREFLADALVIETGTDARKYAHALLDVAASRPAIPTLTRTAAIGLTGASPLEDRIRRVVGGISRKGNRLRYQGAILVGLISVGASACLDPFAKPPTPASPPADGDGAQPAAAAEWTDEEIERRLSASPFPAE